MRAVTWGPVSMAELYTGGANGCGAGTWTERERGTTHVPAARDSVRIT
ncbi:hypothetical protein AB0395_08370 [Streptosporangium sp. NPDC051023]